MATKVDPSKLTLLSKTPLLKGGDAKPAVPQIQQIRCPSCGVNHGNPALSHTYRYCQCGCVMRESSDIDIESFKHERSKTMGRLLIIAASFGHQEDAKKAIDVRNLLQDRVEKYGAKDRLSINEKENLVEVFGANPCFGEKKCIRVRFYIEGRRSETVVFEGDKEGYLQAPGLFIVVPKSPPTLVLGNCMYGHPRGLIKGRGAFDVKEKLQALVEESGGTFLEITNLENLRNLFGDPCPNRRKNIVINYEIHGAIGKMTCEEVEGRLKKSIDLSYTPIIAPLIVIDKATYGLTPEGIAEKVREIQLELYTLTAIQNRKALGLPVSVEDNSRLLNPNGTARVPHLQKKLESASSLKEGFVDVTGLVQRRVEECGGGRIDYPVTENLSTTFGTNPNPGFPKQLRIVYTVLGHDSERMTHSEEITYPSGYPRNYIMPRDDHLTRDAVENMAGEANLLVAIYVECPKVLATLEITQGFYGKMSNYRKVFDVTAELRQLSAMQGGNKLKIRDTDDLFVLFRDPARGVRKELKLSYTIRGFSGSMRIEEHDNYLASTIQIGYAPPHDSDSHARRESRRISLSQASSGLHIMSKTAAAQKRHSLVVDNTLARNPEVISHHAEAIAEEEEEEEDEEEEKEEESKEEDGEKKSEEEKKGDEEPTTVAKGGDSEAKSTPPRISEDHK